MLIKICGLTSVADALAAAEAGADWIGLNFHPASPRCVGERIAREILAALPSSITPVGVFVDRSPREILEIAGRIGFDTVQLHGAEPVEALGSLESLQIVRAFRIADAASLKSMSEYVARAVDCGHPLRAVLLDAFVPNLPGGTGHAIDDDLLDQIAAIISDLPPVILAGGLTPENVGERIARLRPWMVDVASGVESAPGRKDASRVSAFIRAAKERS